MTSACAPVRRRLDAYFDGELSGADRLRVAKHVAGCDACAQELNEIRALGDLLRSRAAAVPPPPQFAGLAAGVVSRTRAEASQSWMAMWHRAVEDWQWALVGAGSLCAAVFSVLTVSLICVLSQGGERADSLAALLNNLEAPAGTLFVIATPVGRDQVPMLMQVEPFGVPGTGPDVLPAGFSGPSGGDLALALAETVVRPDGRVRDLRSMSRHERQHTEAILDDLRRLRAVPEAAWAARRVSIQRLGFVTNTRVMGKAL
jgi:anti-sigma factor RsiW